MKLKILIFLLIIINSVILNAQPKDGLVAYWKFDEIVNGFFKDVTGNGNDAFVYGDAKLEKGVKSNCYKLNGSTFAELTNHLFMDGECNITFATWFKIDGNNAGRYLLFSSSDSVRGTYDPISLELNNSILYDFGFEDTKVKKALRVDQNKFQFYFKSNEWYHLVAEICYDGVNSKLKIYINGNLIHEVNEMTQMEDLNSKIGKGKCCVVYDRPMQSIIGALNNYSPWNFVGCLDEMMFYNRCLTDEEIKKLTSDCQSITDSIKIIGSTNTSLNFDTVKVNSKICKKYLIQNKTNNSILLNNVNLKYSNNYEISSGQLPLLIPGNSTKELEICFLPKYEGLFVDSLIVKNACSETTTYLFGYGKHQCVSIMDSIVLTGFNTIINYDSVEIKKSKCLKFKIRNKESVEKKISNIRLKNNQEYSIASNTLPIILPPYGEKKVEICFTPKSKGQFIDSLEIFNDCSSYKFGLKGYGKEPCIDIMDSISIEGFNQSLFYDSVDIQTTKCLKFKIKNKDSVEKKISNIRLKNNKEYSIASNSFPITLPPYGEKEVEICFTPKAKSVFIDSLEIFNDCSSYKYGMKGYGKEPCSDILDSISIEGINTSLFYDSVDTKTTKCLKFKIKNKSNIEKNITNIKLKKNIEYSLSSNTFPIVIPPFGEKEVEVCFKPKTKGTFIDSLEIFNNCSSYKYELKGYGRSDCIELYDMLSIEYIDSSKTVVIPDTRVADTKTIKCRIYNYSNIKVKLDEAFFAVNQSFSYPHAQLPVYIEAKSYFELIVYYKPSQYGTERDTLILNNDCSNLRIPFVSKGLQNEFLGESKCEATIKAEGVLYSDSELIFYPPYPNPTKNGFYINYSLNSNISRTVTIDFCNSIGECNNQLLVKILPGSNRITFDSELLDDGYNILRIKERDELKTFIIIKE